MFLLELACDYVKNLYVEMCIKVRVNGRNPTTPIVKQRSQISKLHL